MDAVDDWLSQNLSSPNQDVRFFDQINNISDFLNIAYTICSYIKYFLTFVDRPMKKDVLKDQIIKKLEFDCKAKDDEARR